MQHDMTNVCDIYSNTIWFSARYNSEYDVHAHQ